MAVRIIVIMATRAVGNRPAHLVQAAGQEGCPVSNQPLRGNHAVCAPGTKCGISPHLFRSFRYQRGWIPRSKRIESMSNGFDMQR